MLTIISHLCSLSLSLSANLPTRALASSPALSRTGIYFGFARLKKPRVHLAEQDRGVYPFVMSLGYNPFYGNTQRTGEVHIMHQFASDFYGLEQRVVILGYLRPEYNYETREGLIEDIETDKRVALASLRRPLWQAYASDPFLGPGPGAE
ncbi:riboflavin kinase [Tilletiopsis washingtonensis]|uniref:Riboflavin kinase n=1 Tax=Tilletiopsis washingtonensis TaxID=58919 RepID=A0A316Z6B3_9BASI|nr:riboflavin kinase [Tilletiopsis washingtonensis]PWN97330.1 riboflavin kinase [Tilletiopsis washingtonensis]